MFPIYPKKSHYLREKKPQQELNEKTKSVLTSLLIIS